MGFKEMREAAGSPDEGSGTRLGVPAAAMSFLIWGFLPLYWKLLISISPFEVVCHRGLWCFVIVLPITIWAGRMPEVRAALRRNTIRLLLSTFFLSVNWLVFTWAVTHDRVLETSLGNFINPLLNMLCGVLFFRDRPRPMQWFALLLAFLGVGVLVIMQGSIPWVALGLSGSFAVYAVLRKIINIDALSELLVENGIFSFFAVMLLTWFFCTGATTVHFSDTKMVLLLMGGGCVTAIPMGLYVYGARRLKLTTLGLLHYLLPTATFLLSVFVFREPFTITHLTTFLCIWAALILYTFDAWRAYHPVNRNNARRN